MGLHGESAAISRRDSRLRRIGKTREELVGKALSQHAGFGLSFI